MPTCRGPRNPLLMLRQKGHGPLFQQVARGVCAKGMGNYYAPGMPGGSPRPVLDDLFGEAASSGWGNARATGATTVDNEGNIVDCVPFELTYKGLRREQNLAFQLTTHTITVISGREYAVTVRGDAGATCVASGAFTGTLTADGSNRISWPDAIPKTAASTSLTLTVTGSLIELLVQDVTGRTNQAPSEYFPFGIITGSEAVRNGDFNSPDYWENVVGNSVIEDGKLKLDVGAFSAVHQDHIGAGSGQTVRISFTIEDYVSGSVYVIISTAATGSPWTTVRSGNGTYTEDLTLSVGTNLYIRSHSAGFVGSISNISVRSAGYNGSVDGIQYFATENENEVHAVTGVVTEKVGAPITAGDGLVIWDQRTQMLSYPACVFDAGTQWDVGGGTAINLSLNALGRFPGVETSSDGATWHRLNHSVFPNLASGTVYAIQAWYKAGTSGRVLLNLRDNVGSNNTSVRGPVASPSIGDELAGTIGELTVTNIKDDIYSIRCLFTPNFTGAFQIGIGPDTAVSGENIVTLAAQVEEGFNQSSFIPAFGAPVVRESDLIDLFPAVIRQDSSIVIDCSVLLSGPNATNSQIVLWSTDDRGGGVDELKTNGVGPVGYLVQTGGGRFDLAKGSNIIANGFSKWAFSVGQEGSQVQSFIIKDGVTLSDQLQTQTLDHSDKGISIGRWLTNVFPGLLVRRLTVFDAALSEEELLELTSP